jgi:hypothetical protein
VRLDKLFVLALQGSMLALLARVAVADLFEGDVVDKVVAIVAEDEAVGGLDGCACMSASCHVRQLHGPVRTKRVVLLVALAAVADERTLQTHVGDLPRGMPSIAALHRLPTDVVPSLQRLEDASVELHGFLPLGFEQRFDVLCASVSIASPDTSSRRETYGIRTTSAWASWEAWCRPSSSASACPLSPTWE